MKFYLHSQIQTQHTEIDFLRESGTILLNVEWNSEKIILVELKMDDPEFVFLLSVEDGDLVFQRNETTAVHPAKEHIGKDVWIGFIWDSESIKTFFRPSKNPKSIVTNKTSTPFTLPPPEVLQYARESNRIPSKSYSSVKDFSHEVVKSIQLAQIEINQTAVYTSFWNTIKKSGKIINRVPKDEIDIHNSIHSLIFNHCLRNGINIEREKHTAVGDIDFVFSTIINQKKVEIPCEVKKSDSQDLFDGYETQLPTYMNQLGVNLGIYLIVGFSGEWYKGDPLDDILVSLDEETNSSITQNIRALTLDVSKPVPASKRK